MDTQRNNYSPHIVIYLEIDKKRVRLADVLNDTATLYESTELPPQTKADLVFLIDGVEEREEVILHEGVSKGHTLISFTYLN